MQKVDLVLRNAKYLDADKREFVEGDIAIKENYWNKWEFFWKGRERFNR